jgi:AraC family transcriptional regulator
MEGRIAIAQTALAHAAAPARDVTGISIDWLFECPSIRLTRWSCLVREKSVTGERQQFWHVIGFPHGGSYMLHAEGEASLIDANTVAFFNPLGVYRTSHPNGCGDHGGGLVVRPDVIADAASEWDPEAEPRGAARFPSLSAPSSSRSYWIQNRLFSHLAAGGPIDPLEVEEGALALVAETVAAAFERRTRRIAIRPETVRRRREGVQAARALLARRYREPLRLEEVAAESGLSIFHLCRMFKEETGISVYRYLHRLRLRAALRELPERRGDLTALALDLGYSSHSHFTSAFRREFGVTPSTSTTVPIPRRPSA